MTKTVGYYCPIQDELCPYAEVNEKDSNVYCQMVETDRSHPRDHCDAFYGEDEDEEDDE